MTRRSCHRFKGNEVRLWLSILACNLGNFWRRLALPLAEAHLTRGRFAAMLRRIEMLALPES